MVKKSTKDGPENGPGVDVKTSPTFCTGTKVDGDPCGMWEVPGTGYCYRHDPEKRGEALEASRRGGAATRYRATRKADLKGLVTQLELLTGSRIVPGEDGAVDYRTLEDLRVAAMIEIARIQGYRAGGEMGVGQANLAMGQWYTFVRQVMIDMGLGAEARIKDLEDAAHNQAVAKGRGQ